MGSWTELSFIFIALFAAIIHYKGSVKGMMMPSIYWDPKNPIFNCPSRGINTILVKFRYHIGFICPLPLSNTGFLNNLQQFGDLYENLYFVKKDKEQDALNCNVNGYKALVKCNQPNKNLGVTMRFVPASGSPDLPVFNYGETVYFLGTGNGQLSGIDNTAGGRCNNTMSTPEKTFKMILKLRVCTEDEENVYKNCTVCENVGCYTKGCALYNEWTGWTYQRNVTQMNNYGVSAGVQQLEAPNSCTRRRHRKCSDDQVGCDGPSEEIERVTCPVVQVTPNYEDCTGWVNVTGIYQNSTGRCFKENYRNCSVGGMEKMKILQFRLSEIYCPIIATVRPTTSVSTTTVCSNWTSTHQVFRNSSGHCFQLYSRDCVYRGCSSLNATERKLGSVPCPLKQISSISSTTGKASTDACNSTAPITVTRVSLSERVVVSTRFIAIKPTISTNQRNTLYTQLPCTRVVGPIPTPTTKGSEERDTGEKKCPVSCTANDAARQSASLKNNGENAKSYVIPVVCAVVGAILGAVVMYFFIKQQGKIDVQQTTRGRELNYLNGDSTVTVNTHFSDTDDKSDKAKKPITMDA